VLEVGYHDGQVEWSMDPQMHRRQSFNDSDPGLSFSRTYSELTNRGIMIRFNSMGLVEMFDFYQLMNVIIQALVLYSGANQAIAMAARNLIPKRDVYDAAIVENCEYQREMAHFAAQAAMISYLFKTWTVKRGISDKRELTKSHLVDMFSEVFDPVQAHNLATEILFDRQKGKKGLKTSLTFTELLDVMTDDRVDIKKLMKHATEGLGRELGNVDIKLNREGSQLKLDQPSVPTSDLEQALAESKLTAPAARFRRAEASMQ